MLRSIFHLLTDPFRSYFCDISNSGLWLVGIMLCFTRITSLVEEKPRIKWGFAFGLTILFGMSFIGSHDNRREMEKQTALIQQLARLVREQYEANYEKRNMSRPILKVVNPQSLGPITYGNLKERTYKLVQDILESLQICGYHQDVGSPFYQKINTSDPNSWLKFNALCDEVFMSRCMDRSVSIAHEYAGFHRANQALDESLKRLSEWKPTDRMPPHPGDIENIAEGLKALADGLAPQK